MPSCRMVLSWFACCVVLGNLAAGVSYAQTAQSPPTPKGQTSKQGEECSAKTKGLADLAQQSEYQAAVNAVEKTYQVAPDAVATNPDAQGDPAIQEMYQLSQVYKKLETLPDETLEMAEDFFGAETGKEHACLSAALRTRRMDAAEHMAQNLHKAWNRHTDLLLVLSERHQKERDDEAVESAETLQQDLQGCQGWQKDVDEIVSALGTTIEQASDEKWWDGLNDEQHRKLMKFYITEKSVGFWCGAVAIESGAGGRADARAYLAHASKYAALDTNHIIRMYNNLLHNYDKALQWNHNALKALDDDQKLLAEDEKVIQLADRLLSRPPQPPLVFVQPAYMPPPPQDLHCVTQLNGSFAYTNCY